MSGGGGGLTPGVCGSHPTAHSSPAALLSLLKPSLPLSCRAGAAVLAAGELVGIAEVGILATVGAVEVQVHSRPHVGVLSTGEGAE